MSFCVAAATRSPAAGERRLGLVITNQNYSTTAEVPRLQNAYKDGDVVEAALKEAGFEIPSARRRNDLGLHDMQSVIDQFISDIAKAKEADPDRRIVAFVYYSGHGASDEGQKSYLIPVGAPVRAAEDLAANAVPIQLIVTRFEASKADVFLVIDACRNELPRTSFKGLAPVVVNKAAGPALSYVVYASTTIARDNHLFASVLAERIRRPPGHHAVVFNDVIGEVHRKTGFAQTPLMTNGPVPPFFFKAEPQEPRREPDPLPKESPAADAGFKWEVLETREKTNIYFRRETRMFKEPSYGSSPIGVLPAGTTLFDRKAELGQIANTHWYRFRSRIGAEVYAAFEDAVLF